MGKLRSKTFKRMFLSYVTMIVLCFIAYSVVVIHEAVVLKREQAEQYYILKGQEAVHQLDRKILTAQQILTNVNGMSYLNQLYRSTFTGKSVDSYILYQVMQDMRQQKTGTAALHPEISSVVCLLNGYNRVYTSEDVIRLDQEFSLKKTEEMEMPYLSVGNLNTLTGVYSDNLTFTKEFLIYGDVYHYRSEVPRGLVYVLFDEKQIRKEMDSYLSLQEGWKILYHGEELLRGGIEESSYTVRTPSVLDPRFSIEILGDSSRFRLESDSVWSVAMGAGIIVSILFLCLAFFYSNFFYEQLSRIWKMIGLEKEQEDGFQELANGIEQLMGERDGYRNEILTISPYAETGMIHSLLSGELDDGKLGRLYRKDILSVKNMFFIISVIHLAYETGDGGGIERMRQCRNIVRAYVHELGNREKEENRYLCFERDKSNFYLVINTNQGEDAEELIYHFYQELTEWIGQENVSITMAVDEVKEQIGDLPLSCQNAMTALNRIFLEGRGGVYFYEENEEANGYYFPKEVTRQLTEDLSQERMDHLIDFLADLKMKNMEQIDISNRGIEMLLDDLYVSTVKAVQRINSTFGLEIRVEKLPLYLTFDEVEEYYRHVYEIVIEQVRKNRSKAMEHGTHDTEIIEYVNQNFMNPEISLTTIGEHFSVSTRYITALFKQNVGITYLQYVQERRIAFAVHQMRHTQESLEEIAKESGYSNMLTFRRNFKSIMGMNPSDFERQM